MIIISPELKKERKEKGWCTLCGVKPHAKGIERCTECSASEAARLRAYYKKIRFICINHYSKGTNKCACPNCPETNPNFLTIDHINGGGTKHRKEIDPKQPVGNRFYRWLIQHNFPEGYRVLCWNCNCGKASYGVCPHETYNSKEVIELEILRKLKNKGLLK